MRAAVFSQSTRPSCEPTHHAVMPLQSKSAVCLSFVLSTRFCVSVYLFELAQATRPRVASSTLERKREPHRQPRISTSSAIVNGDRTTLFTTICPICYFLDFEFLAASKSTDEVF